MAIRVSLHHRTSYQYNRAVRLFPQVIRLRPAPHCRTPILSYSLRIEPSEHFLNWQQDPHGNFLARAVFPKPVRNFIVDVDLVAELTVTNPFDFFLDDEVQEYPFQYASWLDAELAAYRQIQPPSDRMRQFIDGSPRTSKRTIDVLVDLNFYVHRRVGYIIRLEPGVQTCDETLEKGTGSCRDSSWLLVQLLRNLGFAARFVSGYLIQLTPDVKPLDGPAGTAVDFSDLHAWVEVYLPGAGWIGLDPTSGLLAGEGHLPLAATPDSGSAAPITGGVEKCESQFEFSMSVTRIHEDPRTTKPYTDEQWARIESVGNKVDDCLSALDVRLTMGGEPTFVSIDDMESPEWNTAALGDQKRHLAGDLLLKLADRFAASPLLHFGQGKWYPGEQLPRWALGCYWRKDGHAIWNRRELIATEQRGYSCDVSDANRFSHVLARRLGVSTDHVITAWEDAWYYLWKERRLPANVDPLDSNLKDPIDRARLARLFEQGLDKMAGFVLPLRPVRPNGGEPGWASGPWFLRSERLFLLPGDSPIGYRLPLDSLLASDVPDFSHTVPCDPFESRNELPVFHPPGPGQVELDAARDPDSQGQELRRMVGAVASPWGEVQWVQQAVAARKFDATGNNDRKVSLVDAADDGTLGAGVSGAGASGAGAFSDKGPDGTLPSGSAYRTADAVIRTAVCVEVRQKIVHVFMPPLGELEDYLRLVSVIESTAQELELPVRIEGYPPPHDPRLVHFKITPDPGVIEVNLQPVSSWKELASITSALYEEARLTRLGTEKFMLDGRHTGTGGGNHIVLGGATPADSPFLRRPDLLQSLITYWNNRPSLSYLFSGLFVGPTSQAPRVDEARHESVYELETAFAHLPKDGSRAPWIVDRVLRNLLVDVTGNTHRAEFCIDKLFSPDSSAGRLGLVEFRAFEMPPHAQMSLAQQLLVRALVARFWREPYQQPLVRWATGLHDRFMLPHFLARDFAEVIEELREAKFEFEHDWFLTHFEFRFPLIGRMVLRDIQLELRQAMEPWHVLGEEGGGSGTVRHVDSSLERVQVKIRGITDSRYALRCNGRRVPLMPTDTVGEFVAGVRFRAWQPPSCLHPTIGVHSPLVFDLIDNWNQRVVGGCTWHVAHPGGRSFDRFPINSYEAESRRSNRFIPMGYRGERVTVLPEEQNSDYPYTLDLRRPAVPATLDSPLRRG